MKTIQKLTTLKVLGIMLATICLFAAVANAAPTYAGKFTLPYEVRWGKAVLPAGQYVLTLDSPSLMGPVTIREANGKAVAHVLAVEIHRDDASRSSALIITRNGDRSTVQSLRLAEVGLVLRYEPDPARRPEGLQEAKTEQTVKLTAAAK